MRVSFIIPLYNCLPLTQAMLASLQATLPPGLTHEIIFVDDGSTDGTRDWLKTLTAPPFRVLLNERNLGYAVGNNRAATVARGEFLVLLNSDLVLTPGWLEPMFAAHEALRTRAGLIGNVQVQATSGVIDHTGIIINRTGKPEHDRRPPSHLRLLLRPLRQVPAVTGACLLVERALWQQLGGFDESYVNGGEDIDLGFRARAVGRVNAVALRSIIRHHVSASPGRKLRDEENSARLVRRWQREFVAAAEHATRDWCREYLEGAFVTPLSSEYRLAINSCLHAAHLRPTPPMEAVHSLEAGQAREFARWQEMFGATSRSEPLPGPPTAAAG
ncbi:MAG TPA: glycosyltransferase family 2 protein [Opitutaceae bacterium]|nr:glycosyltransferase family 2 protein [Opitutaceae bacterium]